MALKPRARLGLLRLRAAAAMRRNRTQLALTAFLGLACAVAFAMESRNDALKRRIRTARTIEEEIGAEEHRLLEGLARQPDSANLNRQIRDFQRSVKYRYELDEE